MRAPLALSLALSFSLSCSYSPNFDNDKLMCGALGVCPKGYSCATDNRCWKTGELGNTNNDAGTGGSGGNVDAGDPLAKFVGNWTFTTGTFDGTCSDSPTPFHTNTASDRMAVVRGGGGVLAQYYCDSGWTLRVPTGSTTASAPGGQTCRRVTTDAGGVTTTFDWSVQTFTFTTTDGLLGTVQGHISGPFNDSGGATGTCEATFSGQVTRTP